MLVLYGAARRSMCPRCVGYPGLRWDAPYARQIHHNAGQAAQRGGMQPPSGLVSVVSVQSACVASMEHSEHHTLNEEEKADEIQRPCRICLELVFATRVPRCR